MVGVRTGGFTMSQATLKVASNEAAKHTKTCSNNQHTFIPFAFDTLDFLVIETVDLIEKIQRLIHNNVIFPPAMNIIFNIIDFTIQN